MCILAYRNKILEMVLFHRKINSMQKKFILISFELPYFCFDTSLRFWPLLKGEDFNKKNLNVRTTSFSPSDRGHQDCNNRIGCQSLSASNGRFCLQKYIIRDLLWKIGWNSTKTQSETSISRSESYMKNCARKWYIMQSEFLFGAIHKVLTQVFFAISLPSPCMQKDAVIFTY